MSDGASPRAEQPNRPDLVIRSASLDDTAACARAVARLLVSGDVLLLTGELGAGKTAFTKALGAAVGVTEPMTSPTFTIMRSYDAVLTSGVRLPLLHLDAYRLEGADALEGIGLFELLDDGAVAVIEWGDLVRSAFGSEPLEIALRWDDEDDRTLSFVFGSAWSARAALLHDELGVFAVADSVPTDSRGSESLSPESGENRGTW